MKKKTREEVEAYEKEWREASNKYNKLKNKVKAILSGKQKSEENRGVLIEYLCNHDLSGEKDATAKDIIKKHRDDIIEVNKNPDWWIFSRVSGHFNYKILMAHTKFIGYHRTKNKEFKRGNALFNIDGHDRVTYDTENPKTVLDFLRSGKTADQPNLIAINFSDISKSITLRLDHRFYRYVFFEEPEILSKYKKKPFMFREAIVNIRNGKDVKREYYSIDAKGATIETDYKYVTVNNIRPDGFVLDDVINISSKVGEELSKSRLQKNEIVITRSGSVGIAKIFTNGKEQPVYIPSGYLIIVKIDEDRLIPEFMEYFLNSKIMRKYFDVFGTGKTQKNIAQGDIKRIPIPDFSKEEQERIVGIYKTISAKKANEITQKEQEINLLRAEWEEVIPENILSDKLTIDIEEED